MSNLESLAPLETQVKNLGEPYFNEGEFAKVSPSWAAVITVLSIWDHKAVHKDVVESLEEEKIPSKREMLMLIKGWNRGYERGKGRVYPRNDEIKIAMAEIKLEEFSILYTQRWPRLFTRSKQMARLDALHSAVMFEIDSRAERTHEEEPFNILGVESHFAHPALMKK